MKKVLVTAGRSNLGKAIRKAFSDAGYEVFYTVSSPSKADTPEAIYADLTDEDSVVSALSRIEKLDVLVNNAGVFTEGSTENLSSADFDKVMDINVRGLFLVTRTLLPALTKCGGSIVNIASMNAVHPGFGTSHYDASKGAVAAFTASLAAETGLRVNALAPGLIDVEGLHGTELEKRWASHTVRSRMMDPTELAAIVLFLAESTGIFGQTILADNGYCLR